MEIPDKLARRIAAEIAASKEAYIQRQGDRAHREGDFTDDEIAAILARAAIHWETQRPGFVEFLALIQATVPT